MRKVLIALVALVTTLGLVAPASSEPNLRREESAYADWMVPTEEKNHFTWYGAYVWRNTAVAGAEGWFSFAGFIKGRCIRKVRPNSTSTSCRSTGAVMANPQRDFDMSIAADGATLRAREDGRSYKVRWAAADPHPALYGSQEYCWDTEGNEGRGAGGGIWREAHASGTMFGQRFRPSSELTGRGWAGLSTGVMVSECSFRDIDYNPDTGVLRVTFTTPR